MLLLGRKGQKGQGHSNVNTEPSTLGIQNFAKTMRTKPHDSSTMESDERWDDVSDEDLLMVDLAALGGSGCDPIEELPTNGHVLERSSAVAMDTRDDTAPLTRFRRGQLWVTDLVSQSWCEQRMVSRFTHPVTVEDTPAMITGTNIHLARELAIQDSVTVEMTSREDAFGLKVLNIITTILSFLNGCCVAREIPIFGVPFECGIFVTGIIDELRCVPDSFDLDLVELKTRSMKTLPSRAQTDVNVLQVSLYEKLWDDLVAGRTTKAVVKQHTALNIDKEFGADLMAHISAAGLGCGNLDEMLDELSAKAGTMKLIRHCLIEYCHQADASVIALKDVLYDEHWLETRLLHSARYWRGEREAVGVDIEEAWKCGRCEFADVCEWRRRRAEECARSNSLHSVMTRP